MPQLVIHRWLQTEFGTSISTVPEGFELERYARESGRYDSERQIELVISFASAAAEHQRKTPLAVDRTLRNFSEQGAMELAATVTLDQRLRWWLRRFGSQVEVLARETRRVEVGADSEVGTSAYNAG